MLHTNVIEKSGFRPLEETELLAVGGGWSNEDTTPGQGGFQNSQVAYFAATGIWVENPVIADSLLNSPGFQGGGFEGGNGGETEYQGEIIVTPNIQDYDPSVGSSFYAHLNSDGTYAQFEYMLDGAYGGYWQVVGGGTWSLTINSGQLTVGTSFTMSGPNYSYTFTPTPD